MGWAVADVETDELLGSIALFDLKPGRDAEIGYWTHPDARGRGLTIRAARLALGHGFGALGLSHVAAYAAAGNAASLGVLEALGMRRVGVRRRGATTGDGRFADLVGYDLLPEELSAG